MADIVVQALSKQFGNRKGVLRAVDNVSVHVAEGELLVLLGPSGCGETTALRCVAGLENPDSGSIRFGEQVVYDRGLGRNVPIHRRDIGFTFQNYALWPHMKAFDNVRFPLRARGISASESVKRVREVAALLDLRGDLLEKHPGQLSGGQQQRVAPARALVAEPSVVLFDEPLSNLDARLREQLRLELRSLHRRVGFTGVYVTHDLAEALALGDRIAVMREGRIVQVGAPAEVFEHPLHVSTARLLGLRRISSISNAAGPWRTTAGGVVLGDLPAGRSDGVHELLAYTDKVRLRGIGEPTSGEVHVHGGVIEQLTEAVTHFQVVLAMGSERVRLSQEKDRLGPLREGESVVIDAPRSAIHLFDPEGGALGVPQAAGIKAEAATPILAE